LVNGGEKKGKIAPQAPPRPSILTRTASTMTDTTNLDTEDTSDAALRELQDRNFSLQREREALREALERMQEELMQSENRCEMYRSQLQAMKQLFEHQRR